MTQDITPVVRGWLEETPGGATEPLHIYPTVATLVHRTPQQRGLLPPVSGRFRSMFGSTSSTVAGVVLATLGGMLLAALLATQPSDLVPPAVSASASASPDAEATAAPERLVQSDIVPGVDLVTEVVEPGVLRVVSDGTRETDATTGKDDRFFGDYNIAAGGDGSVWIFDPGGFYPLGGEETHAWAGPDLGEQLGLDDFEVAKDGSVWRGSPSQARGLSSFDGRTWTRHRERPALGVEADWDGSVWAAWLTAKGRTKVGRLSDDGWEVLAASPEGAPLPWVGSEPFAVAPGGPMLAGGRSLHRYRRDAWEAIAHFGGRVVGVDAAADGTIWVRYDFDSAFGSERRIARYRLSADDWDVFDEDDGVPQLGDVFEGMSGAFNAAPDGMLWLVPAGDGSANGTLCDGVVAFDGATLARYLRETCVYAMDVGPHGAVWLRAGVWRRSASEAPGPIHTYVITTRASAEQRRRTARMNRSRVLRTHRDRWLGTSGRSRPSVGGEGGSREGHQDHEPRLARRLSRGQIGGRARSP